MKHILTILTLLLFVAVGLSQDTTATIIYTVTVDTVANTITITETGLDYTKTTVFNDVRTAKEIKDGLRSERDEIILQINNVNQKILDLRTLKANLQERRQKLTAQIQSL